jgi:hypothetical protein
MDERDSNANKRMHTTKRPGFFKIESGTLGA